MGGTIWQKQESSWLGFWGPVRLKDVKAAHEMLSLTLQVQKKSKTWFLAAKSLNFLACNGSGGWELGSVKIS